MALFFLGEVSSVTASSDPQSIGVFLSHSAQLCQEFLSAVGHVSVVPMFMVHH